MPWRIHLLNGVLYTYTLCNHLILCHIHYEIQIYYEQRKSSGDDTAVNGMKVMCRGLGMNGTLTEHIDQRIDFSGSEWSSWSSTCSPGTAVCALGTRVEKHQGVTIDDGALTDAQLYCCEY